MNEAQIAKIMWENLSCLSDDYSNVEFELILRRPRYGHLRDILFRAAEKIIEASASPTATSHEPS